MLQINIDHCGDDGKEITIKIVKDDKKILAVYNSLEGQIDLDVCVPYIGQQIEVNHIYPSDADCYKTVAKLDDVSIDEHGFKCIEYTPSFTKEFNKVSLQG